jgi:glycosyltransferase involved in cell wall biosynthesis
MIHSVRAYKKILFLRICKTRLAAHGHYLIVQLVFLREDEIFSLKPFLTIAVPNFNQADNLIGQKHFIESLGPYLNDGTVEVVVSDNNSSDDSLSALTHWPKMTRVFSNRENLGFGGNIERLAQLSQGSWILFLGAGDVLACDITDLLEELRLVDNRVGWLSPSSNRYGTICPFLSENIFLRSAVEKVFSEKTARMSQALLDEEYMMWPHAYMSLEILRLGYLPYKMSQLSLSAAPISEKDWNGSSGIFSVLGPLAVLLRNYMELTNYKSDMSILKKSIISWVIQDRLESKNRAPIAVLGQMISRLGSGAIGTNVLISLLYSIPRPIYRASVALLKSTSRFQLELTRCPCGFRKFKARSAGSVNPPQRN